MTPGRKFSTTTSAVATSRRATSTPRGDFKSRTMLFLPAFNCPKLVLAPCRSGGRVRIMSPSGASILTTSAPRSASIRPQCGPAIVVVKSSTRRPAKALVISITLFSASQQGRHRATNVKLWMLGSLVMRLAFRRVRCQEGAPHSREDQMAFRNIQAEMASYRGHNGDRGESYYALPAGSGPFPGVVVIHHMPGRDEWTCQAARQRAHY